MKKTFLLTYLAICYLLLGAGTASAQVIDADSHKSIVAAFQSEAAKHPPVFPMEALGGGRQGFVDGFKNTYFGYGERRYSHRTDFHPAFDVAYDPLEVARISPTVGKSRKVRAPKTYLKSVYAIQKGVLISVELKGSGYKVILKHTLETPYFDSEGRAYHEYYTCYRHVDPKTLDHLTSIARRVTNDNNATIADIAGKHVFEAGDQIAFVGFNPNIKSKSRVHLDFSLNLFSDPDKGSNIRKYSVSPLLLFPAFKYAEPGSHALNDGLPAYAFSIPNEKITPPKKAKDGRFQIELRAGGMSKDGIYLPSRYFALNGMNVTVINDGVERGKYTVDRHRKLGYSTASYKKMDSLNTSIPHFSAPLGEQNDVFRMNAVVPSAWLETLNYDWTKPGYLMIDVFSIWDGATGKHRLTAKIPLD